MAAVVSGAAYVASTSSSSSSSASSGVTLWQANGPLLTATFVVLAVFGLSYLISTRGQANRRLSQISRRKYSCQLFQTPRHGAGLSAMRTASQALLVDNLHSWARVVSRMDEGVGANPFTRWVIDVIASLSLLDLVLSWRNPTWTSTLPMCRLQGSPASMSGWWNTILSSEFKVHKSLVF